MNPSQIGWGLALGLTLGLGLWSFALAVPALGRPRLLDRVAPFVSDVSTPARLHHERTLQDPLPVIGAVVAPLLHAGRALLTAVLGGEQQLRLRIRQAGLALTVEQLRAQQVMWGLAAGAAGVLVSLTIGAVRSEVNAGQFALPVLAAVTGVLMRETVLKQQAMSRMRRISSEFPTVLEFLSLSLSAGESIHDSIRRVARVTSGELASEFGTVVSRTSAGVPLSTALGELGRELGHVPLERCLDHLIAALERGAPLSEILRAQARDARDVSKRELLESAGRKELLMMVPLVFLILPTTVCFAIWPGIFVLNTAF